MPEPGSPGSTGNAAPAWQPALDETIAALAASIGYPLLVKAVAGGGGKGMRTVTDPAELSSAVRAARSEASAAFGDASVYLERRLTRPRHIEVQLLGDAYGTVSSTVIALDGAGRVARYLHRPGQPCRTPTLDLTDAARAATAR